MASLTAPRLEGTVEVGEGRKLGFADFGPISGRTIVWLHGTPGARRQIPEAARSMADTHNLRIIGVDRPGVGLSTSHRYDSVLDFAAELEMLLDRLDIDRFAVIGLSGGGPYTLAVGHAMPERVVGVAVLGGVAPTIGVDRIKGGIVGIAYPMRSIIPMLVEPASFAMRAIVRALSPVGSQAAYLYGLVSPEGDRRVLAQPEVKAMFLDDLTRNTRRGFRAPMFDLALFVRHWGFRLADIDVPVRWWHGDSDHIVPLSHGQHTVPRIPDAELYVRPGESHLGGLGAAEEVLDTLIRIWDASPARIGSTPTARGSGLS